MAWLLPTICSKDIVVPAAVEQAPIFQQQPAALNGLFQSQDEGVMLKWFGDEIVCTAAHGFDGHVNLGKGGHHDDGELGIVLLDDLQQLQAIHPGIFMSAKPGRSCSLKFSARAVSPDDAVTTTQSSSGSRLRCSS
jgi:hypothetical protein